MDNNNDDATENFIICLRFNYNDEVINQSLMSASSEIKKKKSRALSTSSTNDDEFVPEFDTTMDDADMVELGLSREMVGDEIYLPCHPSRDWIRCFISSSGSGSYRMYIEGKKKVRFLLSAKQFSGGDSIYISSSEEFPLLDIAPRKGYLARLRRLKDSSYTLYLNHCHLCDHRLGFFSCGGKPGEREIIARISHHFKHFDRLSMDYKCLKVRIPSISDSGKRKIWCHRAFKNMLSIDLQRTSMEQAIKELDINNAFCFRNQLPEWNTEMNSLVIKFQGNRILAPSSRNFLLIWERDDNNSSYPNSQVASRAASPSQRGDLTTDGRGMSQRGNLLKTDSSKHIDDTGTPTRRTHSQSFGSTMGNATDSPSLLRCRSSSTSSFRRKRTTSETASDCHSEAILQFGQSSPTRFALDFRYPLSPIQAFGIALTSFTANTGEASSVT